MSFKINKNYRQTAGKIRRFLLIHFRKPYVVQETGRRQGECNQCGNCCQILFRCPFLVKQEDGTSLCSIYENRPNQCDAFPINEKCMAEVDFDCSYTFTAVQPELIYPIKSVDSLHQAD